MNSNYLVLLPKQVKYYQIQEKSLLHHQIRNTIKYLKLFSNYLIKFINYLGTEFLVKETSEHHR